MHIIAYQHIVMAVIADIHTDYNVRGIFLRMVLILAITTTQQYIQLLIAWLLSFIDDINVNVNVSHRFMNWNVLQNSSNKP